MNSRRLGKKALGDAGERSAAAFLAARGYRLLEQNWRCRSGELDIIAEKGARLIFVEVRTRQSDRKGTAAESVDVRKQWKLRQLAQIYLQQSRRQEEQVQFDVLALMWNGSEWSIQHIEHAF
ncbi:UPF0102 protein [Xylanibacillus composti]|uniref:UPF0102 protein XYCOK13_14870 n=1 Tax=Xylanibacillus composti TaxID=1572762 RepID=A0A8J4H4Q7_9BACL|nr:YraN family protein [Xylanibacillus composti]GIQ68663.1 UPF0102 protein [Xylanibacillus composti]